MKTSVLSLAVVALAGAALGDVYFTYSTPGADFNDPANWQNAGDALEGENLRIPNGCSPRMTADLTAFSIDNWNWDVSTPFDLDLDGHTLRFTSYAHWQNSMTNIFRNGTLRFVDGAGSRFWYENTWTPGQVVFD